MKRTHTVRRKSSEAGVALLIALFALLLISVVAIAMIVASGTETALGANYRSSSAVYYAAMSGLEEGRGRLLSGNPNYISTFFPGAGGTMPLGTVGYILNPAPGETVAPTNLASATTYPDSEYWSELGAVPITVLTTTSTSSVAGIPGPLYKWVRVNPVTEQSLNLDVNNDGTKNSTTTLYYDGSHLNLTQTGKQVLEITTLAALPDGSQKIMQYVAASTTAPPFPGAMSMVGQGQNQCQIQGVGATAIISGLDHAPGAPAGSGTAGIALNNTNNYNQCLAGIAGATGPLVVGAAPNNATPSMRNTTVAAMGPPLDPRLDPALGLNSFLASIVAQANQTINGDLLAGTNLGNCNPNATPPVNNPMITVVNNPTAMGAISGCGILLIQSSQAQLQIDGNITFNGVIMLIATNAQAQFQMQSGTGSINGAFFMAAPAGAQMQMQMQQGPSGGINYDSRWINNAFAGPLQILAFKEINQ